MAKYSTVTGEWAMGWLITVLWLERGLWVAKYSTVDWRGGYGMARFSTVGGRCAGERRLWHG